MAGNNIFRGKTAEEAVANGLKQLGLARDEVSIEILDEGKKGILKMGSKDAEVRIIKKDVQEKKAHTFEQVQRMDVTKGIIWVENGQLHCTDPVEGELTIRIPPMVLFYKNNELVKEKSTISEKDDIKIDFKNEEVPTKWNIELSKNRLTATLKIEPGTKSVYKLRDQKPARELTLETIKSIVPNLTLTEAEIYDRLKSLGITYGIQVDQIEQACKSIEKAEFVIAKGESPVEGKNGWLEYKVEINEGKRFKEREDGSIDYRAGKDIPSVDAGTEIAIINDPIPGKEGKTVTGETIPPKPVFPLQVKVGNGTAIKDNIILSTSVGRPSVQKRANIVILEVVPKIEHQGDVNMASGNLKFNGDIIIRGNVEENMEITATGNIEVRGTISEARIKAGQSAILLSNVISSEIIAGNSEKMIVEKTNELKDMLEELKSVQHDLYQISQSPSFSSFNLKDGIMPLMKVLIQSKHAPLVNKIRQFLIAAKDDIEQLSGDWQNILKQLYNIFIMMDAKDLQTFADFDQLVSTISYLIEISNVSAEIGVFVQLPSAMNSSIYSSGDVIINKQGCYNTTIHAQGLLQIKGFVRGGSVYGGQGATIDEAGSKSGTPTLITVPHDKTIVIKNAYADTTIQIGKKRYTFRKDMTNIFAKIDEDGSIAIR